ncbi:hypothetical protein KUTeg_006824 [Tegillarca granosa]|uniref:Uncharacterized protein n=1 Tax=Tegillarca granosa TaxID=220873 RepID=A0ABQ9FBG4_TEGGR|nr:hypothetical protein KUTeg_006824 [Tegillarca granosa]
MESSPPDNRRASSYIALSSVPEKASHNFLDTHNIAENGDCILKEVFSKIDESPIEENYYEHVVPAYPCEEDKVCLPTNGEIDHDVGYSSHSTCSSCYVDSVQMEQGSHVSYIPNQLNIDWSDTECEEGYLHGENEVEDLLYHFERLDTEVQKIQNTFHSMLTEQQIHVRQIVHTVLDSSQHLPSENVQSHDTQNDIKDFKRMNLPDDSVESLQNKIPQTLISIPLLHRSTSFCQKGTTENLRAHDGQGTPHSNFEDQGTFVHTFDTSKDKMLLKMMTLVCGINTVLQRKEYRT